MMQGKTLRRLPLRGQSLMSGRNRNMRNIREKRSKRERRIEWSSVKPRSTKPSFKASGTKRRR